MKKAVKSLTALLLAALMLVLLCACGAKKEPAPAATKAPSEKAPAATKAPKTEPIPEVPETEPAPETASVETVPAETEAPEIPAETEPAVEVETEPVVVLDGPYLGNWICDLDVTNVVAAKLDELLGMSVSTGTMMIMPVVLTLNSDGTAEFEVDEETFCENLDAFTGGQRDLLCMVFENQLKEEGKSPADFEREHGMSVNAYVATTLSQLDGEEISDDVNPGSLYYTADAGCLYFSKTAGDFSGGDCFAYAIDADEAVVVMTVDRIDDSTGIFAGLLAYAAIPMAFYAN